MDLSISTKSIVKRLAKSHKAARQRLQEESLCGIDAGGNPDAYFESLNALGYPYDENDKIMNDRTTSDDMKYVDQLTEGIIE